MRKGILAEASSVFDDMFGIPQPENTPSQGDTREGLPVVRLEENSDILQWLLRLCYPGNTPRIDDLDNLRPVIRAAMKYDIPEVLRTLKENLSSFAESMPVRVYAIALQFRFEAKAREAARAFLARPVESADVPELVEITGKDLHNLLKYHRACSVVAARVASDPSWVPQSEVWFGTCRAQAPRERQRVRVVDQLHDGEREDTGGDAGGEGAAGGGKDRRRAERRGGMHGVQASSARTDEEVYSAVRRISGCGHCPGKYILGAPHVTDARTEMAFVVR